jgi:DNA (cytosine-5)-methyltransferase 1
MATFGTAARAALASRSGAHGGVPVGAVVLRPAHVDGFRKSLERALAASIRFRGVDRIAKTAGEDENEDGLKCLHLPVEAALRLEDLIPDRGVALSGIDPLLHDESGGLLLAFMHAHDVYYYQGVRYCEPLFGRHPLPMAAAASRSKPCGGFTFAEIFSGIGGFRLGLEPLGGRCTLASEINAFAADTYRANFETKAAAGASAAAAAAKHSDVALVGDICSFYAESLPDFDVLTAGFPCQPFSARGEQRGFGTCRGQLYLELCRLLRAKRPAAFLFENVQGLVTMSGGHRANSFVTSSVPIDASSYSSDSSDSSSRKKIACHEPESFTPGTTFSTILAAFAECGYATTWRVLNSGHWLPQWRERVYLVGVRSDLPGAMDWAAVLPPVGDPRRSARTLRCVLEARAEPGVGLSELTAEQWEDAKASHHRRAVAVAAKKAVRAESHNTSLTGDQAQEEDFRGGNEDAGEVHADSGVKRSLFCPPQQPRWGAGVSPPPPWWRSVALPLDGKAPTLTSSYYAERCRGFTTLLVFEEADGTRRDGSAEANGRRPRLLSPRECARCMGFPDTFVIPGQHEIAGRGRFYAQIGNAVCPPVIEAIGAQLLTAAGLA